ncbi:hypothetical protein ACN9MH_15285 [Paenibacillus silvae]|uniref:hypothetical protein n=1 Tax=Paenibacillus silvae TaxID=1325358 RepID=UPI003CF8472C
MAREIVAFASSEEEIRRKLYEQSCKYPNLTMSNLWISKPATTPGGGIQYVGKCILS